jgi:hypothetical protein
VPDKDGRSRSIFCGPFAVAAITGRPVSEICKLINVWRRHPPQKHVKGTYGSELLHVLRAMDWNVRLWNVARKKATNGRTRPVYPTLAQWLQSNEKGLYIVGVTNHWVVINRDWLQDTRYRTPVDMSRKNPYSRRRVTSYLKFITT